MVETPAERAIRVSRSANTPADTYGPLYEAVELARVFPDNKTFVDLIPHETPEVIMSAFHSEKPAGREALGAFVARYFHAQDEAKRPQLSM